ncbi:fungal-specific transcription factor domain-containing protein [Truncatella angustata]|uniref:Fungal-specific transcription factor domain-containing protein n=1 Tax=Truncatella angustata TaxID=152316 RepID=A0A9P8RH11_9PEZI|nr:fungal-specific transcription factor domain-containing protein [Truncatella angustata]KAH6645878.1 fungal-specific transcription factor domain-containing protein [Truncatella angustata]KAH8205265.1 hypothetical protein TruAng_000512 [Truncatella angustata]
MATAKACQNCRKRRLRCDRSIPGCNKCLATGQECLGYGKAYQWTNAVASRGRMAGKQTFASTEPSSPPRTGDHSRALVRAQEPLPRSGMTMVNNNSMPIILTDPLFQHMDTTARFYLNYFSKRMCQELVTHDSFHLAGNPFRQLIAMSTSYSFLQHILVASSAMHYSNLARRSFPTSQHSQKASIDALVDALRARHDAIKGLQVVLERNKTPIDRPYQFDEKDALLATILFFVNFALIDSGKGGWRSHMKAARSLIAAQASNYALTPRRPDEETDIEQAVLSISDLHLQPDPTPHDTRESVLQLTQDTVGIRDYVASDSVAYYIWGTTFDSLWNSAAGARSASLVDIEDIRSIIDRTEANSYHSCPAHLLLLILRISRLARSINSTETAIPTTEEMDCFVSLLREAQDFNPESWAVRVSAANAHVREVDELEIRMRTYIAYAYRAGVCLYVLLAAPGLEEHVMKKALGNELVSSLPSLPTTKELATTILSQLSLIPNTYPLFKYTTWPVFMTGVEAATHESRAWTLWRLNAMWELCPWGMMKSAGETLREIWQLRDGLSAVKQEPDDANNVLAAEYTDRSWLIELRRLGSNFLIV